MNIAGKKDYRTFKSRVFSRKMEIENDASALFVRDSQRDAQRKCIWFMKYHLKQGLEVLIWLAKEQVLRNNHVKCIGRRSLNLQ